MKTFIERAVAGEIADPGEEIHEVVSAWHNGSTGMPLYVFLGMTREEYGHWVEDSSYLPRILEARRKV